MIYSRWCEGWGGRCWSLDFCSPGPWNNLWARPSPHIDGRYIWSPRCWELSFFNKSSECCFFQQQALMRESRASRYWCQGKLFRWSWSAGLISTPQRKRRLIDLSTAIGQSVIIMPKTRQRGVLCAVLLKAIFNRFCIAFNPCVLLDHKREMCVNSFQWRGPVDVTVVKTLDVFWKTDSQIDR